MAKKDSDTGFADGPEFWFDKHGKLWFGHNCKTADGAFDREYTLPEAIYEIVSREPVTVLQPIGCTLCDVRGFITGGKWVPRVRKGSK